MQISGSSIIKVGSGTVTKIYYGLTSIYSPSVGSGGTDRVLLADGASFLLQFDGSSKVLTATSSTPAANTLLLSDTSSHLLLTDGASRLQLAA